MNTNKNTDFGGVIVWEDDENANRGQFGNLTNAKQLKYLKDQYDLEKSDLKLGDRVQFDTYRNKDVYWVGAKHRFIKNEDSDTLIVPCSITRYFKDPVSMALRTDFPERPNDVCLDTADPFVRERLGGVLKDKKINVAWSLDNNRLVLSKPGIFYPLIVDPNMSLKNIHEYFKQGHMKTYDQMFRLNASASASSRKSPPSNKTRKCRGTKVINPRTNRCWGRCPRGQTKNPKTYKCVKDRK